MKHIVMFSGGAGSFITADLVIQEFGKENVILLFADTKMEDEDLYRFLADSSKYFDIPVTVIAEGRDPWQIFIDKKFLGNSRIDPCSMHLKRDFMDAWLAENFEDWQVVCYVGIDYSEKHRIERLAPRKLPWKYRAPMVDERMMLSPEEKTSYLRSRGVEPPRLYALGFPHNNCGGFCVKAGLAQFKLLYERLPERYNYHVKRERELRKLVPKARPFLQKTVKGVKHYVWLEDYRTFLQSQEQLEGDDAFDWGGCGCAID